MTTPVAPTAAAAGPTASDPQARKLKAAAEGFEAVMMRQMLGSMRSASLGDGIFDSSASEQFREMADAKTAEAMAHKGVFGIADLLMKQYGAKLAAPASAAASAAARPADSAKDPIK